MQSRPFIGLKNDGDQGDDGNRPATSPRQSIPDNLRKLCGQIFLSFSFPAIIAPLVHAPNKL